MKQFDLNKIKQVIEEKFHWGSSVEWTNFHFKELRKSIEEVTGDSLSEETLKRIFGKRKVDTKNYQPQAFSKLALIKFADSLQQQSLEKEKKLKIKRRKTLAFSFTAVILLLAIVFISNKQKDPRFTFTCKNPVDISPFTAPFNYDISEIDDSVFVNFGYRKEVYVPPENNLINAFYRFPGVYVVKLYTRSKMLDTLKIIAYSTDWEGGYFPNRHDSLYEPFVNQSFFRQKDWFYAPPENLLLDEGVDLKQRYYTSYRFFSPFKKSLDSLGLKTKVLNNASTGSMLCYDTGLILIGDSGIIEFNFTQPRCSRYAGLRVSEKRLSGEDTDLNTLAVDMSDWLNIGIKNENNVFNLYLADQLIYRQEYKKPLGNLIGIIYYFYGTGKVDYLKLSDGENKLFYSNDFSKKNKPI